MRNSNFVGTFCFAASLLIVLAVAATNVSPAAAETLFLDTFSSSVYTEDINAGVADPGRQSGTLGPLTYEQTNFADKTYLGGELVTPVSLAWNAQALAMHGALGGWSGVSPRQDFGGSLSAGGQIIEYDATPGPGANWIFTHLGFDHAPTAADPHDLHLWTGSPHLSFFVIGAADYMYYQIWDTGNHVEDGPLPVNINDLSLHHYKLVCTDPTDGNPFDGVGQTDVEFYLDDVYITSFTKGGGGYANNYVSLSAYLEHSEWDNLEITQVPEPSTLTLLAIAALGLICPRCRKN